MIPSHVSASASNTARATPQPSREVRRSDAAGGPTINENTSSTPTTCAASATATATISRNKTDMSRSETPLASASSGASVAKSSGRAITARTQRLATVKANSSPTGGSPLLPTRSPSGSPSPLPFG